MAKREDGGSVIENPGGPGIPPSTTRRDAARPTPFGGMPQGPFVDPAISDPAALKYAQGAVDRRRPTQAIPRYHEPVAGGPDVPIPPLTADPMGGLTMAQQAAAHRLPQPAFGGPQQAAQAPSIVSGAEHLQVAPPPRGSAATTFPSGILPSDLLPDAATKDATFRQGHGDRIAANQPEMAFKYGVIRNGQFVPPQQLAQLGRNAAAARGGAPQQAKLSNDTVRGLEALEQFNAQRSKVEGGGIDQRIAEDAAAGPAGAAGATEEKLTEAEQKNLLADMDEFDITRLRNALYKDLLNNDGQKKIIEARLKPLDLTQLVSTGRVTQVVPIIPGKFEPEFQSYGGDEDLIIKRLLALEIENLKSAGGSFDRYITDRYTLMGLTVSVRSVNKRLLPDVYDAEGNWNDDMFWAKYKMVSKFNFHMIGSLVVNWFWFDLRVRHLFKAEALGNG